MPRVVQYIDYRPHLFSVHGYLALFEQIKSGGKKHLEAPCVVFMAFLIEAYVNSLGFRFVPTWSVVETLPWRKKIELLHIHSNKPFDWGRAPLDFALKLFRIRDKLAHGKPDRVVLREIEVDEANPPQLGSLPGARKELHPDWYAEIDREWIMASRPRLEALLAYLAGLHGLRPNDFQEVGSIGVRTQDK